VIEKNTKNKATVSDFIDRRVGASVVVYPQPFGFQAEYNVGTRTAIQP
jgi:hypothetical protein